MRKNVFLASAIMLSVSLCMLGQEPPRPVSPEVQSDGHVTFRLAAPNAAKVVVNIDKLIEQGKAKPMIVVMPMGYGDFEVVRRGWDSWSDKELAMRNLSKFTDILLGEVIPQIEQSYRTKK